MNGLKAAARVVRNYARGYSDAQTKVYSATSNDPGEPSVAQMNKIAEMSYNDSDLVDIMEILVEKRLNDKGKDWRRVYKSLILLDDLLHQGSENVLNYFKDNLHMIETLTEFQYVDVSGKDQGLNVRTKAIAITLLLQDEWRLRSERRARIGQSLGSRMTIDASESRASLFQRPPNESSERPRLSPPPWHAKNKHRTVADTEDRDLGRAFELSQEQPEDVDLRLAIEASLLISDGRQDGVVPPRPPLYAVHYMRDVHDASSVAGSEYYVSAESAGPAEEDRPSEYWPQTEPYARTGMRGATTNGDFVEEEFLHDERSSRDFLSQRRGMEPTGDASLLGRIQISPPIPSGVSSSSFPSAFVPSMAPSISSSLPQKRSPLHEVDPDIRIIPGLDGSNSSEDSSRKSGSSSRRRSRSITPSTSLEPVAVTTSSAPRQISQLPPRRSQELAAEQLADTQVMPGSWASDSTLSAAESNASAQSSEGPASWQTEAYIDSLLASWERRRPLLSMLMLPDADRRGLSAAQVHQRLGDEEARISALLIHILGSREARRAAQRLESDRIQSFVDAIQDALDRGTLPDSNSRSKARHLMQKVSEAGEQLPSSLFIEGVSDHDEHPTFGGGFGDVFQASYQGKMVALKRIRTFTADSTTHRHRLQFYKEALVWQGLRHHFILPLLGIDSSTFAPSFCMVSPWMKHGTVLKYLRDHGREQVNRLLLEIAQGLDYLHSMNVVHGDLRGTNILITDDKHACLSDFGLATTIADADSTMGVTSSSNHAGSVRWFAPELIEPTNFGCTKFIRTKASDVYAYACVCIELYTGNPPFSHLQDVAVILQVIKGERPKKPPAMPVAIQQLVTLAWMEDSRARPTIHDIAVALERIP
ncbi:Kinase-like protein [Mycena sanguinolenta]|uniref:Kinase-like protein n=1 Tax=Mycena sanguinolenta TaxID=230812 RepID=A0A8H6X8S0_9AGAR|nr:Kinase-like protein [Mycena sanguinolenta]